MTIDPSYNNFCVFWFTTGMELVQRIRQRSRYLNYIIVIDGSPNSTSNLRYVNMSEIYHGPGSVH